MKWSDGSCWEPSQLPYSHKQEEVQLLLDTQALQGRQRWLAHGALVREVAESIRARKYIQSHTLDTEVNAQLAAPRGIGGSALALR